MDLTSNQSALPIVLAAFSGVVAMVVVQACAWRGAGEAPCPGRAAREAAEAAAGGEVAAATPAPQAATAAVAYAEVTLVAQRKAPSKVR